MALLFTAAWRAANAVPTLLRPLCLAYRHLYNDAHFLRLPACKSAYACALQSIAVQMQRVHAELKAQVWGPWGQHLSGPPPPPNTSNPTRLLQLWDYEASLSIQVRGYCHVAAADGFTL